MPFVLFAGHSVAAEASERDPAQGGRSLLLALSPQLVAGGDVAPSGEIRVEVQVGEKSRREGAVSYTHLRAHET
eukprot:358377-Hanusia_phi.AAC.1